MCLSIPGKVVEVKEGFARVDYGSQGIRENVDVSLIDAKIGSYVLVQGGFAIKVLTAHEAEEVLEMLESIASEFGSSEGML
jgi:hydrogenase expression/formation protein HypC